MVLGQRLAHLAGLWAKMLGERSESVSFREPQQLALYLAGDSSARAQVLAQRLHERALSEPAQRTRVEEHVLRGA